MLAKSAGQTNFLICHLWKITIRDMPSWKFKRHLRSVRFKLISPKIPIANLGIVYAPWLPRKEQGFLQTIFLGKSWTPIQNNRNELTWRFGRNETSRILWMLKSLRCTWFSMPLWQPNTTLSKYTTSWRGSQHLILRPIDPKMNLFSDRLKKKIHILMMECILQEIWEFHVLIYNR